MSLNKISKAVLLPAILILSLLGAGCSMPVCCAPEPDLSPIHSFIESELRQQLISESLDLFANRQFDQLTALYAKDIRHLFRELIQERSLHLTDEKIKSHIEEQRNFEFSKETLLDENRWKLTYRNKNYRNQLIIYTVIKEEGEYRILDESMGSVL